MPYSLLCCRSSLCFSSSSGDGLSLLFNLWYKEDKRWPRFPFSPLNLCWAFIVFQYFYSFIYLLIETLFHSIFLGSTLPISLTVHPNFLADGHLCFYCTSCYYIFLSFFDLLIQVPCLHNNLPFYLLIFQSCAISFFHTLVSVPFYSNGIISILFSSVYDRIMLASS